MSSLSIVKDFDGRIEKGIETGTQTFLRLRIRQTYQLFRSAAGLKCIFQPERSRNLNLPILRTIRRAAVDTSSQRLDFSVSLRSVHPVDPIFRLVERP